MDYENFCKNLQRIKDTLERYHEEEEKIYKDNISFLDQLIEVGTYRKISVTHKEFLRELFNGKVSTISNTKTSVTYQKHNNDIYNKFTNSNNLYTNNETLKNTAVKPITEEEVIRKFMEAYNNNKLSDEYVCLTVDDKYAYSLSTMINVKEWEAFIDKNNITLTEGPRAKYYAYKVPEKNNIYFLVPTEAMKESFSETRIIQNAFLTFFNFDWEKYGDSKRAILVKPAIVKEKDGAFKLLKNNKGEIYKGILKF